MKKITQDEYDKNIESLIESLLSNHGVVFHDIDIELTPSDIVDFMADDPDYSKAIFDAAEKIAAGNADGGCAEILDSYYKAVEAKLKLIFEQRYIVEKHL